MEAKFKRLKLTFILDNCPLNHNNPVDCPLYQLRASSIKEKNKWLENLSEKEINNILDQHEICYSEKKNKDHFFR